MKISNVELLEDLKNRTLTVIKEAEEFLAYPIDSLTRKEDENTWSALECIEHLNRYSKFYLPEISNQIASSNAKGTEFKSGMLGNYFAKSMLPKEKLNKMKTFKNMNANACQLDLEVIHQFLTDQKTLLKLLNDSVNLDLSKTKTAISISKMIKLRLGDTFRVVIYHNQRHIGQAKRAIGI